MIERNLGNFERIIRLSVGIALAAWVFLQPAVHDIEWFVVIVSIALIFNGIFSRCYVCYILDINTRNTCADTPSTTTC